MEISSLPGPTTTRGEPTSLDVNSHYLIFAHRHLVVLVKHSQGGVETLPEGYLLTHSKDVSALKVSPDGKLLATGDHLGSLSIWDLDSREKIDSHRLWASKILGISWSPDGQRIGVCGEGQNVTCVDLCKLDRSIGRFDGHAGRVNTIVCGHNLVISGSDDAKVNVYSGQPFEFKFSVNHDKTVQSVAANEDGSLLASCGSSGCVHLYDGAGQLVGKTQSLQGTCWKVAFVALKELVVACADRELRFIDCQDPANLVFSDPICLGPARRDVPISLATLGSIIFVMKESGDILRVSRGQNEAQLVFTGIPGVIQHFARVNDIVLCATLNELFTVSKAGIELVKTLFNPIKSIIPLEDSFLCATRNDISVFKDGALGESFSVQPNVVGMTSFLEGRRVCLISSLPQSQGERCKTQVTLVNLENTTIGYTFVLPETCLSCAGFGNLVAFGSSKAASDAGSRPLFVYSYSEDGSLSLIHTLETHRFGDLTALHFTGDFLGCGDSLGLVTLFDKDFQVYQPSLYFGGHTSKITSLSISRDYVLTSCFGGRVSMFPLTSTSETRRFTPHGSEPVTNVSFDGDSHIISSGYNSCLTRTNILCSF